MLDIMQIQEILPHRYPLLLVDRITEMELKKSIKGFKNISISEPAFQGHFPGHPIYPGVMILEGMAQCGGVLALKSSDMTDEEMKNKVIYFMSIDKAKFRNPAVSGVPSTVMPEIAFLHIASSVKVISKELSTVAPGAAVKIGEGGPLVVVTKSST
jgi:3-hydroxyacyl-[acyl-carrier-protein] dehydratase